MLTNPAGVQLLHSLIYLGGDWGYGSLSWGSTLTLPDILVSLWFSGYGPLGFNSYTP